MTSLGQPLFLYSDVVICAAGRHECAIVTDGIRAYAFVESTTDEGFEFSAVVREGHVIQGLCPARSTRRSCESHVDWDLSADAAWQVATPTMMSLLSHAKPIEIGDASV